MIEVAGVSKSYGGRAVVDDVSLVVPNGGVTSLIGANGAGKSTLLSMVARLLPVDAGRITVDGTDVARAPSVEVARRLAILRQENHVPLRLTVRELVAFGRYPHRRGRSTGGDAEHVEHVERALRHVGLLEVGDRYLDELSGGQRQRAFVAMVLCQDTDHLLLDEPLNNLDMKQSVEVMRLLRRAADELGKTVVLVLHDINFASAHSDRVVAMHRGRVVADGPPAEVLRRDVLRDVFDLEVDVHDVGGRRVGVYWS